ncbi:MAG TPA: rhomboid family intramembrane serine protease [Chloroflexota bacterium]|nr:rhomboid family intramembrane serine protease [Chloroflexota bacterium]
MIPYSDPSEPQHSIPFVNVALILANFGVFFYELHEQTLGRLNHFYLEYSVIPCEIFQRCHDVAGAPHPIYITILTGMFMHAGWLHILGNMIFLWVFGDNVENAMGHAGYLIFYLLCGVAAAITQSAVAVNSTIPALGASGAIAGVLAAYLVLQPTASIGALLFVFIIPLPIRIWAWLLIGFWFVEQLFNGVASLSPAAQQGGVAFFAHIGGFVCGLILVWVFKRPNKARQIKAYHQKVHASRGGGWPGG